MTVYWTEAPRRVLTIAERLIKEYHPDLELANIAFIIREGDPPITNGKMVLGKAAKFPEKYLALVDEEYHFLIWLADKVLDKEDEVLTAIIDHELYHCNFEGEEASMRGHDIEEFNEIIQRYGLYRFEMHATAEAFKQSKLWDAEITVPRGMVGTMSVKKIETGE